MRILIVNSTRLIRPPFLMPLGICQVAAAAEAKDHIVRLLDLCFVRNPESRLRQEIKALKPDCVGVSIGYADDSNPECTARSLRELTGIMDTIRRFTDAYVVIGGCGVNMAAREILELTSADYAIVGEGESAFLGLIDSLSSGNPPAEKIISAFCDTETLARFGFPGEIIERLNLNPYLRYGVSAPIETKRVVHIDGTDLQAAEHKTVRQKPPVVVADEIMTAADFGISSIEFADAEFNVPQSHAIHVCEELIRRRNRVPLHTSSLTPRDVSVRLFRLMEDAGFCGVGSYVESASDEVLERGKKGYTANDIAHTVQSARHTSMAKMWVFVFGAPGETEETANETLQFIRKHVDPHDVVVVSSGIRIVPGTDLARLALKEGIISADEDLLYPTYYFSPMLSRDRLAKLILNSEFSGQIACTQDVAWSGLPSVQRICSMLGVVPPYWRRTLPMMKIRRTLRRQLHP